MILAVILLSLQSVITSEGTVGILSAIVGYVLGKNQSERREGNTEILASSQGDSINKIESPQPKQPLPSTETHASSSETKPKPEEPNK